MISLQKCNFQTGGLVYDIMTSNFNIRDRNWNSSYLYYLAYSDILTDIANSFEIRLSFAI